MEEVINQLSASFDLALMVSITVITYLTLKLREKIKSKNKLYTSKTIKKLVTLVISAILCLIFYMYAEVTIKQIIPTYLLSIAFYDYIIKYILKYINAGYKK